MLGRDIGAAADADEAGDRGRVDDRAAALAEHLGNLGLHAQPDAFQVDPQHLIPDLFGVGMEGRPRRGGPFDAGIVVGAIQAVIFRDKWFSGTLDEPDYRPHRGHRAQRRSRLTCKWIVAPVMPEAVDTHSGALRKQQVGQHHGDSRFLGAASRKRASLLPFSAHRACLRTPYL